MEVAIAELVRQMTLEEKAALCVGANAWQTPAIPRLGIPSLTMADGPHGVRKEAEPGTLAAPSLPATCFPTASALGATWDRALLREMGVALAQECIALGVDVLLGPGNNMKRTPLCGRNFEYFAEDPYLGGELAASLIQGIQSQGVGACLKHYAVNNQEYGRGAIDARVDERALREIYLAAFERPVTTAKPWSVMCAYNRVNGPYCSQHRHLLTEVLRDEWGFEGFVVSDWGAVHDRVAALAAGLDLEMPGPQPDRVQAVVAAVRSGALDEAVLDATAARLLAAILRATAVKKGGGEIEVDAHHALARRIAGEAIVLLKNDGRLLPLAGRERVAVIGRTAQEPHYQSVGSSRVNPTRVDVPLDEIRKLAREAVIEYAAGYAEGGAFDQTLHDEAVQLAAGADVALLFVHVPSGKEGEGGDRPDLEMSEAQVALIRAVADAQPATVVIVNGGSAVAMADWIEAVPAVLMAWLPGQAGGGAIADVLYGVANPSGKLAETFPLRLKDTPAYLNYPGENGAVRYGEGLFIGYRYYDAVERDVLFPFGHGLSYADFDYGNLRLSASSFRDVDGLEVSLEVTNVGDRAGQEVVQVYVADREARLRRPPRELKGFARVALEPGETRTVVIHLDARAFSYYDPARQQWVAEGGEFDILVGASSRDIRLQTTVTMASTQKWPSLLTAESTIREWRADPRGAAVLRGLMAQAAQFVPGGGGGLSLERWLDAAQDFTLPAVLRFVSSALPVPPEMIVAWLLAQVHGEESSTP